MRIKAFLATKKTRLAMFGAFTAGALGLGVGMAPMASADKAWPASYYSCPYPKYAQLKVYVINNYEDFGFGPTIQDAGYHNWRRVYPTGWRTVWFNGTRTGYWMKWNSPGQVTAWYVECIYAS